MSPRRMLGLCLSSLTGLAQAAASVPAAPFPAYQGWQEVSVQDWPAANARVGAIGGWRAYLREAQADDDQVPGVPATPVPEPAGGPTRDGEARR